MHEESLVQVVCGWDAVQEKREEEDATKSSSIIIIIVGVYVVDERLFEDLVYTTDRRLQNRNVSKFFQNKLRRRI